MPALFALSPDLAVDAIVAVAMVVVEVFVLLQLLPRTGPPPALTTMVIGGSALVGSSGVLMALLGAFLQPNLSTYSVVLLAFNFMMLGPPGFWFISLIVFEDRTIRPRHWFWPFALTAMATSTELLMGVFFTVAGGSALDLASVLAGSLTSAWFLWSMAAAMVALLLWVRLPRTVRDPLLGLAAAGAVAPLVPVDPPVGALLMAVVMAATLLVVLQSLRVGVPGAGVGRLLTGVVAAFLAMSVTGATLALAPESTAAALAFGSTMAAVMTFEFFVLVREGLSRAGSYALPGRPHPEPQQLPAAGRGTAVPSRP
ncbi:MAG: hypothetical protein L3K05_00695 [Thermoplasmata archaeon]|nr:hypothetical protein [Thermoplasmata archaeon]